MSAAVHNRSDNSYPACALEHMWGTRRKNRCRRSPKSCVTDHFCGVGAPERMIPNTTSARCFRSGMGRSVAVEAMQGRRSPCRIPLRALSLRSIASRYGTLTVLFQASAWLSSCIAKLRTSVPDGVFGHILSEACKSLRVIQLKLFNYPSLSGCHFAVEK